MTRDDVLDLLPLHAAGELDADQAAAVEAALADDPSLREELTIYRQLEGFLGEDLTADHDDALPAWLEAAAQAAEEHDAAQAAEENDVNQTPLEAPSLVKRRCPYCHDNMTRDVVVCSACATPHHGSCFADHQGCSMLGCDSTRAADMDSPDARRICPSCEGLSPAEAPFCAWCASPLGDERAPRRRGAVQRLPLRQYLSAASVLLTAALTLGGYFGLQQENMAEQLLVMAQRQRHEQSRREIRQLLGEIHLAQQAYAEDDLDGDGEPAWAGSLDQLEAALTTDLRERLGLELFGGFSIAGALDYQITLEHDDAGRLRLRATPTAEGAYRGLSEVVCEHDGRITELPRPHDLDRPFPGGPR